MALKKSPKKNKASITVKVEQGETANIQHKNLDVTQLPVVPNPMGVDRVTALLGQRQANGIFFPETTINLNADQAFKEFGNGFSVSVSVTLTVPQCNEGILLGFETAREIIAHEGTAAVSMARTMYESSKNEP